MPVKLLNLDDRTFADLVEEERLLIPRYVRPWTDHNVSDPGIMLIELFAWLTEALLYRINRVPDASRMRLLELLGASFQPAKPATLELRVQWEGDGRCDLPRLSRIQVDRDAGQSIVFEILGDVTFTAQGRERTIIGRQTQRTASRVLGKASDDPKLQLLHLEDGFFAPPPARRQRLPQVTVDGQPWMFRPYLRESESTDMHYAYKPWLESIVFGDGRTGAIPPAHAPIVVTYQPNPDRPHLVTDAFASRGQPWQVFRLSRRLELSEAAKPSDLEPHLETLDSEASEAGDPWEYVPRFLDMAPDALQYTVEPWHNAVRFGNGAYGKALVPGTWVRFDYCQTLGAEGNIPAKGNMFSFWVASEASNGSWQQVEKLKVLPGWVLSPGRNPTTLDEARSAVFALLEPGWRAVTAGDFVSMARENHRSVARAVCLPDFDPEDADSTRTRPGHVGIIAVPGPIGELTRGAGDLRRIERLAPDGLHFVASAADGSVWLWDVSSMRKLAMLARERPARLVFSSSGRHLVVAPAQGAAALWNAHQGRRVAVLETPAHSGVHAVPAKSREKHAGPSDGQPSLNHVVFAPNGQQVVTVAADGTALLWEVVDGVLCRELGPVLPVVAPVFSPDGQLLVTAHPAQAVALWRVPGDRPPFTVQLSAAASHMRFSPDGTRLAIATGDGRVRLGRVRSADGIFYGEMTLQPGQPAEEILFDPSGLRLATRSAQGMAILWSARTGTRLAQMSQPGAVDRLVFSGDGSWLATAHRDHTVRCWSTRAGHEAVLLPDTLRVEAMAFSPSGRRLTLAGASAQQTVLLETWDLRGKQARRIAQLNLAKSRSAIVHVSGRWLAYDDEHLVHIWDLDRCRDITTIYADFDDPDVLTTDWHLITSDDPADVLAGDRAAMVRVAQEPYLWIVSALKRDATRRTIQVLDAEHLYPIDATLTERRLVTSRHHIVGPAYTDVAIELTVVARSSAISPARVEKEIRHALARFFDPLHGGPDGTGWPLGRSVYESEVYEVVEGVESVDHVKVLKLAPLSNQQSRELVIPSRSLVTFDVQVVVE